MEREEKSALNPTQIDYGVLSFRALMRDFYAKLYNRGYIIDRMAMADYDTGSNLLGRIEIVEEVALKVRDKPRHFEFTLEETHYAEWLYRSINGQSINLLLRDLFLYGMSDEASLQLSGAVA